MFLILAYIEAPYHIFLQVVTFLTGAFSYARVIVIYGIHKGWIGAQYKMEQKNGRQPLKERIIILASQSPRRKELLTQAGIRYHVEPSQKEEIITSQSSGEVVQELAMQKALDVIERHPEKNVLVIGADTLVAFNDSIMGKPQNAQEAEAMLEKLQGNTHQVYTGVAILWRDENNRIEEINGILNENIAELHFYERTEVEFYPMTKAEITQYIATGEPMDKAGAYGIQGKCAIYIRGIEGDYNNVVGLPIARIYQELAKNFEM